MLRSKGIFPLDLQGFSGMKKEGQGILSLSLKNSVLLRNKT